MGSDAARAFGGTERFRVIRRIGEGGMGVVYEALDQERNICVALKTLRTWEPRAIFRLKHEFRALRDLQHPNLVSFGELVETGGDWFFTMELVRGVDILSWVRRAQSSEPSSSTMLSGSTATVDGSPRSSKPWKPVALPTRPVECDEPRLRDGLRQLALGLIALHEANKVHRDIKPSNILVTPDGRVVILDFGLVSDLVERGHDDEIAGTYAFMAPEQTTPTPVGPPADWYAVGVLLYIALTGRPPIVGPRDVLFDLKRTFEPPPPRTLAPSVPADLDELCSELLRIDPARRPTGADVLRRLGVVQQRRIDSIAHGREAPFVGREEELEALHRAFEESRAGRAVTLLVHGESGVGKTTLARRFVEELPRIAPEAVVMSGRCYDRESVPYKAIDEVVDALSRHLRRLPEVESAALLPRMASLLTHVFPVLLDVDVFAKAPRLQHDVIDPQELRARVFGALRELLARLGDRHPLVLMIDDLQWADADSLALLAEILRPPLAPPLLLVGTVRTASEPSGRHELEHFLPSFGEVRHVWLHNLRREDARRLVSLLAVAPDGERLNPDAIADESEGHPLFIDALVRHRLSHGEAVSALRLEEALWERVDALPPAPRHVLELVAVAGRPLPQSVVARAAAIDLGEFSDAASQLRRANFVRSDGVRSTDAIEPYHDRVRAAVRAKMEPAQLASCNERLAQALEASGAGDPETLAAYWQGAGQHDRAAAYAVAAAARAAKALAFDQAARLYRTALALKSFEGAEGRDVRARLADALAQAGRGADAAEAFRAAAALASGAERMELQRRAGEQLLLSGHVDEGLVEIGSVLASAGIKLAKTPRRALVSLLFHRARLRLRGTGFVERELADLPPRLLKVIDLSFSVAQGLIWVDVLRGAEFQTRLVRLALDAGEPYRLSRALAIEAGFASTAGGDGAQRATALLDTAHQLAVKTGEPLALGIVLAAKGFAALARQSPREAFELNQEAERILSEQCVGAFWELALVRTNLLFSISMLGDLRELASRGLRYVRAAQERGDRLAATSMICGPMYVAALADDDTSRVRTTIGEAMRSWQKGGFVLQHLYEVSSLANTELYEGNAADAYARMVEAWPRLERASFLRLVVTRCWMRDLRARAAVALARQSTGATRERLLDEADKLGRRLAREKLPVAGAQAAYLRGAIAELRGDASAAAVAFDEAALGFDGAQMRMFAAAMRCRRGGVLGGDEGGALSRSAEQQLLELGIRVPERMMACAAP